MKLKTLLYGIKQERYMSLLRKSKRLSFDGSDNSNEIEENPFERSINRSVGLPDEFFLYNKVINVVSNLQHYCERNNIPAFNKGTDVINFYRELIIKN